MQPDERFASGESVVKFDLKAVLVVDNVVSHAEDLKQMLEKALSDTGLDSVIIPVGKGLLVCRKI